MTPPPITFAGQGGASTGHRRGVRARAAPKAPRRVSGPKGGRGAAETREAPAPRSTAGARTAARPGTRTHRRRLVPRLAPFAPRRTSRRVAPTGPLPARALAYVRALPDHPLLDRIVRGRTWIAMLGVMLAGIVAMQVEELKLGASVGRGLSESAALQSKNQVLRATVSALGDDQRIERLAARMGMVMPAPGDVVFLTPHTSADAARAANQIQAPNPTSFLASLPQATSASATGVSGLGAGATAASTTGIAGTAAGTTGLTTTVSTTGGATSTSSGASTGSATAATAGTVSGPTGTGGTGTGTTGTGTTGTGTTGTGTTGTASAGTTGAGSTGAATGDTAAGGAALSPVTTGNGTTGN